MNLFVFSVEDETHWQIGMLYRGDAFERTSQLSDGISNVAIVNPYSTSFHLLFRFLYCLLWIKMQQVKLYSVRVFLVVIALNDIDLVVLHFGVQPLNFEKTQMNPSKNN